MYMSAHLHTINKTNGRNQNKDFFEACLAVDWQFQIPTYLIRLCSTFYVLVIMCMATKWTVIQSTENVTTGMKH